MPRRPSADGVEALVRDAVALERLLLAVLDDRHRRTCPAYSSARRISIAVATGCPSSVSATQPACCSSAMSASCSPFWPARDRADRVDARQVRLGGLGENVAGDAGVVVDRARVRHARDRREAAGDRRRGAGRHGFLVLLPGSRRCTCMSIRPGQTTRPLGTSTTFTSRPRPGRGRRARCDRRRSSTSNDPVAAGRRIDHPRPSQQPLRHLHSCSATERIRSVNGCPLLMRLVIQSARSRRRADTARPCGPTTPLATCSRITEYGPSATSERDLDAAVHRPGMHDDHVRLRLRDALRVIPNASGSTRAATG